MERLKREVTYFKGSKDTLVDLSKNMTKTKTFNMLKDKMENGDTFIVEYYENVENIDEKDLIKFSCEILFKKVDSENRLDIRPVKCSLWARIKNLFGFRRKK